jgi:hypothetical protein
MNPYAHPKEPKVGRHRPKIQHVAPNPANPLTRRDRLAQKQGVAAERRSIKKSVRQHLKAQMLSELQDEEQT